MHAQGVRTLPYKVQAIEHAPPPQNPQQLGVGELVWIFSYLATPVNPLNMLLRKDAPGSRMRPVKLLSVTLRKPLHCLLH